MPERHIRRRLEYHGKKRGRPILLAVRVPDTPERALAIGLDVQTWVSSGWVDLLIAGNGVSAFAIPVSDWVQLAHEHGVAVYGCIQHMKHFDNPEMIRAAAYRYWNKGVDGIYFFNHFVPDEYGVLNEVGEPTGLTDLDKVYQIDHDVARGQNGTIVPGQLPLDFTFESGAASASLHLEIADEPKRASAVQVLTQWSLELDLGRIEWELCGEALSNPSKLLDYPWQGHRSLALRHGKSEDPPTTPWISYETAALRKGVNR